VATTRPSSCYPWSRASPRSWCSRAGCTNSLALRARRRQACAWRGGGLDTRFKVYLVFLVIFTLGNSSDAFLMLCAQTLGFQPWLPSAWSSRSAPRRAVRLGLAWTARPHCHGLGYLCADLPGLRLCFLALACLGPLSRLRTLLRAFEGAANALVADLVPADLRGTAFGLFNGAVGVAAFPASLLAGLLWDRYGAPAPFLLGGGLALVAAGGMLAVIPRGSR